MLRFTAVMLAGIDELRVDRRDDPWRYELHDGVAKRATIHGLEPPNRVEVGEEEWTFSAHPRRWGWMGVAQRHDAARAALAFYPRSLVGGTIATDDRTFALGRNLLSSRWTLRDGRTPLARVSAPGAPADAMIVALTPDGQVLEQRYLVLTFAVWAILREPSMSPWVGNMSGGP